MEINNNKKNMVQKISNCTVIGETFIFIFFAVYAFPWHKGEKRSPTKLHLRMIN